MTKTWQEEFDSKFVPENIKGSKEEMFYHDENHNNLPVTTIEKLLNIKALKQFITDLRKKDCEQLLKSLDEDQILNDYIEEGIKDYYKE